MLDATEDGVFNWSLEDKALNPSPIFRRILELGDDAGSIPMSASDLVDSIHPQDRVAFAAALNSHIETRRRLSSTFALSTARGTTPIANPTFAR